MRHRPAAVRRARGCRRDNAPAGRHTSSIRPIRRKRQTGLLGADGATRLILAETAAWCRDAGIGVWPVRAPLARTATIRQESHRLWCENLAPASGGNAMSREYIAARRRIPRL